MATALATAAPAKTNWADDVDGPDDLPKDESFVGKDGITTTITFRRNEEGKIVKTTRRSRMVKVQKKVSHAVAERKTWAKFGAEQGKSLGAVDKATTTLGEPITIKLKAGSKNGEEEVDEEEKARQEMKKQLASRTIQCRVCKGDHFTNKCPYKDKLGDVAALEGENDAADGPGGAGPSGGGGGAGGKYVPPSMRTGDARQGKGETMYGRSGLSRDEFPTLRVTNLSEDADEADLWELFARFQTRGKIQRIYVGKDQDTGLCKGFAFVSFEDTRDAEDAMKKIDGKPYDHLILSCTWSVPREERK